MVKTKEDNMKKGFAEFFLIGTMIIVCLAINAISKPYNSEDRADIEKSFGTKPMNKITAFNTYSGMTDAQKQEFDKTSPNSPSFW
jgi:hypothetical protein